MVAAVKENITTEGVITSTAIRAADRVIPTDEKQMIARCFFWPATALIADLRLFNMNHTGGRSGNTHMSERRS